MKYVIELRKTSPESDYSKDQYINLYNATLKEVQDKYNLHQILLESYDAYNKTLYLKLLVSDK